MNDKRRTRGLPVWSEQVVMRSEDIMRNPGSVHPRLRLMLLTPTEAGRDQSAEDDLDPVRVELHEVAERLRRAERKLAAIEAMDGIDTAAIKSATTHVRLECRSSGYAFEEFDEPPPKLGEPFELDGKAFVVERFVPSPLPSDCRRCAVLVPVRTHSASARGDGASELA
jgi:hypothetical protein